MMGDYFLYQNVFVAEGIESKSKYNYINHLKKWQQKKTVSRDPLIKRIIDTWSLDVETATEITKYIEYLLRDFITPWYSKITRNDFFVKDLEDVMGNALGSLVSRAKEGLNPVVFLGDKMCYALTKTLKIYSEAIKEVKTNSRFQHKKMCDMNTEDLNAYHLAIAEEFRASGHLHSMFAWDDQHDFVPKNHRLFIGASTEDFFDPARLRQCEENYTRYVCYQLSKHLLVSRDDYNCKGIRHLIVELLTTCVFGPVYGLFTPCTINYWISYLPNMSDDNTLNAPRVDKEINSIDIDEVKIVSDNVGISSSIQGQGSHSTDVERVDASDRSASSDEESSADEEEGRAKCELDMSLWVEQERIVMLYELEGAVDELLQGKTLSSGDFSGSDSAEGGVICISDSKDDRGSVAVDRLLKVVELILYHGVSHLDSLADTGNSSGGASPKGHSQSKHMRYVDGHPVPFYCLCPHCMYPSVSQYCPFTFFWFSTLDNASSHQEGTQCQCVNDRLCHKLQIANAELQTLGLDIRNNGFSSNIVTDTSLAMKPGSQSNDFYTGKSDKESLPKILLYASLRSGMLYDRVNQIVEDISAYENATASQSEQNEHNLYVHNIWSPTAILRSPEPRQKLLKLLHPLHGRLIKVTKDVVVVHAQKKERKPSFNLEKALGGIFSDLSLTLGKDKHDNRLSVVDSLNDTSEDKLDGKPNSSHGPSSVGRPLSPVGLSHKSSKSHFLSSFLNNVDEIRSKSERMLAIPSFIENNIFSEDANVPDYLKFSSNNDIVEVSRMRREASDTAWLAKRGGTMTMTLKAESSDAQSANATTNKAEMMFKLAFLLRDRPNFEFLSSRGICKSEYINYTNEKYVYDVRTIKCEPSAADRSVQIYHFLVQLVKYSAASLTVVVNNNAKHEIVSFDAHDTKAKYPLTSVVCCQWLIKRRYSDFDDLHKSIRLQVSSLISHKMHLPQKNYVQVIRNTEFFLKRMAGLHRYVSEVFNALPECAEVIKFLTGDHSEMMPAPDGALTMKEGRVEDGEAPMTKDANSTSPECDSDGTGISKVIREKSVKFDFKGETVATVVNSEVAEGGDSPALPLPTGGPLHGSNHALDVEGDGPSHMGDMDANLMLTIESRVYSLVNELLDLDGMSVIRRNFVVLLIRSIRFLFSTTATKWFHARAKESASDDVATVTLRWIRDIVWPNGTLLTVAASTDTDESMRAMRDSNRTKLAAMIPSSLDSYIGSHKAESAMNKLLDIFENPYILKSFIYMAFDMILIEVFPELAEKLTGMDNIQ